MRRALSNQPRAQVYPLEIIVDNELSVKREDIAHKRNKYIFNNLPYNCNGPRRSRQNSQTQMETLEHSRPQNIH